MRVIDPAAESDDAAGSPLSQLFTDHQQRLFRLARRLSSSHEEAKDLVQQTFVRVLGSSSPPPADRAGRESWLVTTMVNLARDRGRRHSAYVRIVPRIGPFATAVQSPEGRYLARITVERALGRLDARRRAVVVLHYLEGQPVARVAAMLGVSAVTVRWHLARARRQLAAFLGEAQE
jgi:RNA polymerase sigma-70 factor, ECF subfamily